MPSTAILQSEAILITPFSYVILVISKKVIKADSQKKKAIYHKKENVGFITMGEIEDSISTKGYIIRDETVIKAPYSGRYIKDVDEGEKIQANQRIATVLKDGDDEYVLEEIRKII